MAMQKQNAEPSMEEILASIRRIISEDEQGAAQADDPLELQTPASHAHEEVDDLVVFDDDPEPPAPPVVSAAPPARAAPQPMRAAASSAAPAEEPILSEPAALAAAGAFTRLAGSLQIAESHGQTLEGMVRELLRPMLKEWLEANLPPLVEAKVEAEVQRIARSAR